MNVNEMKIVTDSSGDVLKLSSNIPFAVAPLKIITTKEEFIDDENLDLDEMQAALDKNTDKVTTSCPSIGDWLQAFGDAKYVFCVTITSALSGSYNTACLAKRAYEEEHPDRHVKVIDTLSVGPEMHLVIEKLEEMINLGVGYEAICAAMRAYRDKTELHFILQSVRNLKNNGRVNAIVAAVVGLLGIRIVGMASEKGEFKMLSKCRGEKSALAMVPGMMREQGYSGGKVRITHCNNEFLAQQLRASLLSYYPNANIEISRSRGLCSFYEEKGGVLIGYEKNM